MNVRVREALEDFLGTSGRLFKTHGLREIHGRVWALVYISKEPLTNPQITERLEIAKSSANIVLNELRRIDLIGYAGISDTRNQKYKATKTFEQVISIVMNGCQEKLITDTKSTLKSIKSLNPKDRALLSADSIKNLTSAAKKLWKAS